MKKHRSNKKIMLWVIAINITSFAGFITHRRYFVLQNSNYMVSGAPTQKTARVLTIIYSLKTWLIYVHNQQSSLHLTLL